MREMRKYCAVAFVVFIVIALTSGAYAQTSTDSLSSQNLVDLFQAVMNHAETENEEFSCAISFYRLDPEVVEGLVPPQSVLMSQPAEEWPDMLCGTPQLLEMLAVASRMSGDTLNLILEAIDILSADLDQTHTTTHFEIKYTLTGEHATSTAFVTNIANYLEQSYQTEVLNWGYKSGYSFLSSHYKVSIEDIPAPPGYFTAGIMSPGLIGSGITINKDLESRDDGLALGACAHEYHHASQHEYASLIGAQLAGEGWFVEASGAWMEHEVFDVYFSGNTTDEDFIWFRNRMNRYLAAPQKELSDERSDNGYPSGLFLYFIADNTRINFAGTGQNRIAVRKMWESLESTGWPGVNTAINEGVSGAPSAYNSKNKCFPYFAEANYFKSQWYPSVANQFRSVVSKTVDLTGSDDEIELTAPSPQVLAVNHYGAYYFEIDTDGEEQVNIDFNGNIVDRGLLGKIYPNFVLTVYPDGDFSSRESITITKGKGNATLTCDDAVVVLTRLDDGNLLGTPDGGYVITFTRMQEPVISAMDFENGVDRGVVRSSIPGLEFTSTGGYDWIYSDIRTGQYNYPFYWVHGNFCVWLGERQGSGIISFEGNTTKSVSFGYSAYSRIHLEAYDANKNLIASDYGPGNCGTHQLGYVTVSGENISYVLVHDQGNYWIVDDLVVVDLLRESAGMLPEDYTTLLELLESIDPGVVQSFRFQVTEMAQELEIIMNWGGSEFKLSLHDPEGDLYGEWQSSHPPMLIRVPNAALGEWEIVASAIDVPSNDYPYALVVGASKAPEDLTAPVITIASPLDGKTYFTGAPVHFEWSADDPETGVLSVEASLDGSPITSGIDSLISETGFHTLEVVATNGAGLTSTSSVTFTINDFDWIRPIALQDSEGDYYIEIVRNSTLPIKFAIYDSEEEFVIDSTVRVIVEGTTAEFAVGECDTCIRIDLEEPDEAKYIVNLHTNFKHWEYGFRIGEPYMLKVFFDQILAHQVRLTLRDPVAKQSTVETLPTEFSLSQNYPNPFNPITAISFSLPSVSEVKLEVFNPLGQKTDIIFEGHLEAGNHTYIWDGSDFASGIYLYRLTTGDFVQSRKMILLK
ncbi:MAG: T9SS type A sorting domain-containing protein [Candidatus Zixiibacteriota bacterium]